MIERDTGATIELVDDEAKPADQQNVIVLKKELTVGEYAGYLAERRALDTDGLGLLRGQESVLLFCHYVTSWRGPWLGQYSRALDMPYKKRFVQTAMDTAVRLHLAVPDDPEQPSPKASGPHGG